ncbi:MAG: glycosyltransferase family 4 protein [Deltaproteobacteria bacterium]|nr:glycosyltransferase family 4 protein [Deltaproteobacteria bacterium]
MTARVLIVSKPVVPPYHDGSICLVRDLAGSFESVSPAVLTTRDAPAVGSRVHHTRLYANRGAYAPALSDNLRVLAYLLLGPRFDVWHFVFAPNPRSSQAASLARSVRRVPVVQTVASRPLTFTDSTRLMFGDKVVALSRFTADRLVAHGLPPSKLVVIPPPVRDVERTPQQVSRARAWASVPPDVPMFVYAGDLEFSSGARTVAEAADAILSAVDESVIVFACRAKTPRSRKVQEELQRMLIARRDRLRFAGEVPDLPALLASATAAPFPADDLYGKVDLPYAVLEACLMKVPVVVAARSPLEEIGGAIAIEPNDARELAAACIRLAREPEMRTSVGEQLRKHVLEKHDPGRVAHEYERIYASLAGN